MDKQEKLENFKSQNLEDAEISAVLSETGHNVTDEYHTLFCQVLHDLVPHEFVPLEIWLGLARAFADASGYRISLQAAIVKPCEQEPGTDHILGWRETANAEPILFVETVR